MKIRLVGLYCFILFSSVSCCYSFESSFFWWKGGAGANFGDDLSRVIVERILGFSVECRDYITERKNMMAIGSILHYAQDDDVIWGSGFREDPSLEDRFKYLDVRSVRGPRTRDFLLKKGIDCPEVYGDPAILMAHLFPEFKKEEPIYDYIIMPTMCEQKLFGSYKNVVFPEEPWDEIVKKITQSKLVISSSLHGIIVAESFGIPARLLRMVWIEPLLKYQDYYESTGRPNFRYATSVQEALEMGGEMPGDIDTEALMKAFPWDYFDIGSGAVDFGNELSRIIIEKIVGHVVLRKDCKSEKKKLLTVGSVLHYARDDDVIWGSGFRDDPSLEDRFKRLDVRAIRGPRTRDFLLKKGIDCPEIYGDPAMLTAHLFPEFKKEEPIYDYIIMPAMSEQNLFSSYKNVVLPGDSWGEKIKKITQSKLVISSSLHDIIVTESFGIPARLLRMVWTEPLLQYQDYYESTGRPNFRYATSVQEALEMGGEIPGNIDTEALMKAFPWDYFNAGSLSP